MAATFDTTQFVLSHGRAPRGIGSWAFVPAGYVYPGDDIPDDGIVWEWGTYGDAKRAAARRYPRVTDWTVLS
jgi:hypothetical protein